MWWTVFTSVEKPLLLSLLTFLIVIIVNQNWISPFIDLWKRGMTA